MTNIWVEQSKSFRNRSIHTLYIYIYTYIYVYNVAKAVQWKESFQQRLLENLNTCKQTKKIFNQYLYAKLNLNIKRLIIKFLKERMQ